MENFVEDEYRKKYQARENTIWVCGACGRYNKNRLDVGDESCFLNSILCAETKILDPVRGFVWQAVKE